MKDDANATDPATAAAAAPSGSKGNRPALDRFEFRILKLNVKDPNPPSNFERNLMEFKGQLRKFVNNE